MDTVTPIVVGYDATPDAALAVQWAVDLSRSQGMSLRVVVARGDLYTLSSWADDWSRGLAEEWVAHARTLLVECGAEAVDVAVVDGLAGEALVRESRSAEYVVVGARGHNAITGALQGSVSQHVSRHAHCPVAVVRPVEDEAARRVVVGVDGSTSSLQALEAALHYAGTHRMGLSVVFAAERWRAYAGGAPPLVVPQLLDALQEREGEVLQMIADIIAKHEGVAASVREVDGRPARALTHALHHANLVVVGARGRGTFAGLVLGSVSAEVLRHAHCPVAVVR